MKVLLYYSLLSIVLVTGVQCSKSAAVSTTGNGGSTARFAIWGDYLYTVDKENLKVFSLADATNPVLKNTVPVGFEIETIYPFNNNLFIGSASVVHIFSLDNPESPKQLSQAISPTVIRRCDPVVAKDNVAYATLRTNGPCGGTQSLLAVYDVKNITQPVQVATFPVNEPYGLGYTDTALYVCDRYSLMVFNIKQPLAPRLVQSLYDGWYLDVIPWYGTLICQMQDGVALYDINDLLNPKLIAKIK